MTTRPRGFTLLELLVVVAIVALASAGVSLSLRDSRDTALEREAVRLVAMLESARAQSRASGVPLRWRSNSEGFAFSGIRSREGAVDSLATPRHWLSEQTQARVLLPAGASELLLGPEPVIAAQQLQLSLDDRHVILGTDGLGPFAVLPDPTPP